MASGDEGHQADLLEDMSLMNRLTQVSQDKKLAVEDVFSQSDEGEIGEFENTRLEISGSSSSGSESDDDVPPSGRVSVVNAEMMEAEDPLESIRTPIMDEPQDTYLTSMRPQSDPLDTSELSVIPGSEDWLRAVSAIEVPDLIRWTAERSQFSYADLKDDSKHRVTIRSQAPQFDTPAPFIGLSSNQDFLASYDRFAQNFRDADSEQIQSSVGKYISPKSDFRVNMATYKLADNEIRPEPMKLPLSVPGYLYQVKPVTAAPVKDVDLQHY